MGDPWKDVRFTNGRERMKESGLGTRLLAHIFVAIVGAGGGILLALWLVGETYSHGVGRTSLETTGGMFFPVVIGFGIAGALVGFFSVFFLWPPDEPKRDE